MTQRIPAGQAGSKRAARRFRRLRVLTFRVGEMAYPKMFAIRAGDILVTYAGFTCIAADTLVRIERDQAGLYFQCADGRHYLESQRDRNDECLGLTRAPLA